MKYISDKKLQAKIGFSPYPKQQKVFNCSEREVVLCGGTRCGKSILAAYKAFKTLLVDNKHIWVVSPSYELSKKVFGYIEKWIAHFPQLSAGISTRPFPKIITPWNSWLECHSAENKTSLLGEELDLVVLDECSRIPKEIWESYIYQRLSSRQGKAFFISTPFGRNWFHDKYLENKFSSFHFETRDNPYFPKGEWERAKSKLPEDVFKQEYQALFLEDAASAFKGVDAVISKCLRDQEQSHYYVMGVDLGKYEDFTVFTVIDKSTHKVVFIDRSKILDYSFQKQRIIATAKRYNNARIVIDSTGLGDPIADDLKNAGLLVDDFKFSNKSKKQLIEKLRIFIEQKLLTIPPNPQLLDELKAFGYQLTEHGNVIYSAPQGLHDDCVISLALAVCGLGSKVPPIISPIA